VALLYNTANIRYATGVDVMAVWTAGTFARYCLVPVQGKPILFEHKGSVHDGTKDGAQRICTYPYEENLLG
jgi:hypothetical protein